MAGAFLLLFVGAGLWIAWGINRIDLAKPPNPRPTLLLEASDGTPINQNGGSYAGPVTREEIPGHLIQAFVAIEDRRFYEHMGIDPLGIMRAAFRNLSAGGIVEGGSTITQQLAKNLFLDPEQTLHRKMQEAAIAAWLDFRMSKDEIITKYLDNIYFGAGATGVSAAAKIHFDKPVRELNLAESAMLAGIVRAPSKLNPQANLPEARERASLVLNAMVEMGFIKREEALAAVLNPAAPVRSALVAQSGGWFSDWVEAELEDAMGPLAGAARVRTTLQPRLQAIAENVVKTALERKGADVNAGQAALVAMTPQGAVVAMVGGRSYKETQFNRAVKAKRQPGATFTIALYLAAMRLGWKPDDMILDAPIEIDGWEPKNFEERYAGEVTVEQAFARSLTAATVRLAGEVGVENVIRAARDLGIDAELNPNLALVLGTEEVTPLDLTGAYAAIASGRIPQEPWFVAGVTDDPGAEPTLRPQGSGPTRALSHQADLRRILNAAVRQGTGEEAAMNGFVAGKTGTSQEYRDGWFIGFTDTLVAGVWVGNDDNTPMKNVTGGDLPAEIWRDFMAKATGLDPIQIPQSPPPPAAVAAAAETGSEPEQPVVEEEGSTDPGTSVAPPEPEVASAPPEPEPRASEPSPAPAPAGIAAEPRIASAPSAPEPAAAEVSP
ncbi:MAG: PBP1A family penicillin-binding protein, partial [Pseudomonadota bacterium]|nr:PBP1A family penicillin-binding protein [Pseudomonadota bacterium]